VTLDPWQKFQPGLAERPACGDPVGHAGDGCGQIGNSARASEVVPEDVGEIIGLQWTGQLSFG